MSFNDFVNWTNTISAKQYFDKKDQEVINKEKGIIEANNEENDFDFLDGTNIFEMFQFENLKENSVGGDIIKLESHPKPSDIKDSKEDVNKYINKIFTQFRKLKKSYLKNEYPILNNNINSKDSKIKSKLIGSTSQANQTLNV